MSTVATSPKVKVSAKALSDSPAFSNVSIWVLLHNGKQAGKVLWTIGNGGTWKCSIIIHGSHVELFDLQDRDHDQYHLTSFVIGTAGGGGYDKRSASFADCLDRNGITTPARLSGRGIGAIQDYLTDLGLDVIEAI